MTEDYDDFWGRATDGGRSTVYDDCMHANTELGEYRTRMDRYMRMKRKAICNDDPSPSSFSQLAPYQWYSRPTTQARLYLPW
jgi:hypothetical protein